MLFTTIIHSLRLIILAHAVILPINLKAKKYIYLNSLRVICECVSVATNEKTKGLVINEIPATDITVGI